jgi:hypothetical protein
MNRSAYRAVALILFVAGLCAAPQGVGHACTIDGQPTALADGRRAVFTQDAATAATVRTWAPFSFPDSYHIYAVIRLTEDRAQLRTVLPPEARQRAWLWRFGDGTHMVGWTVAHRYGHPGRYRIIVEAYYPTWHSYVAFDAVRIVLVR